MDITHGLGLPFDRLRVPVSGSERAAKHTDELARGFSYTISAGPHVAHPEQDVPVPNQQGVYSQMHPATSHPRGVEMLTYYL
jgi:hypothetical protein